MSATRVGQRLRDQVLHDAGGRCGYCRLSQEITGTPLEVEHIVPQARWADATGEPVGGVPVLQSAQERPYRGP